MTDPIVRIEHIRKAKMCSRGVRAWMEKYGLDYMTFLTSGYPASVIEAVDDALGRKVALIAREEDAGT